MIYLTPRMLLLLWLGMISGLPLALTAGTLTAWLTETGVDIKTIGIFALVSLPYAYKFLWAPLMDGIMPPLLGKMFGKRRGWMLWCIVALSTSCVAMSLFPPEMALLPIALLAFLLAFASASFDINLDAYRIETLPEEEQGSAAAAAVFGYRIGMLISGAGALFLAGRVEWSGAYQLMALVMLSGMVPVVLFAKVKGTRLVESPPLAPPVHGVGMEENSVSGVGKNLFLTPTAGGGGKGGELSAWFHTYVIQPFKNFALHPGWQLILIFIILYKLGDAFLGFMTNPFLLETGYTKDQIAAVVKFAGFFATMLGSFFGGWLVMRLGVMRMLIIGGILQTLANLPYAYLALLAAPDIDALTVTIAADNFCGGMATVAFVAYISSLCNLRFTATQYALLNSFASFGRSFFTAGTGVMVESLGWPMFFITTAIIGLPAILLIYIIHRKVTPSIPADANR